jgi:hemerythrin-like domain-containing protein
MPKKTTTEPDAIQLLTAQHREVEDLFEEIENARLADDKEALFSDLADKLAIHARIEEQTFYPAMREKRTDRMVLESFVEHTSIKRLLADMLETYAGSPAFEVQLQALKEQVDHHVEEEEEELFPAARKVLSEDDLYTLAREMMDTQQELEDSEPRLQLPQELESSASFR